MSNKIFVKKFKQFIQNVLYSLEALQAELEKTPETVIYCADSACPEIKRYDFSVLR